MNGKKLLMIDTSTLSHSELQQYTQSLRAEIFRLKSVINNLPGSIYWKDKSGAYLGRNHYSSNKMLNAKLEPPNINDEDFIGKTDYNIFPKSIAERYRQHDLKVMETQQELSIEEPVKLPDGSIIIQLSTKRPLFDEEGNVIGIIGNTIDITYLKKIETELRKAKEKAESADKIKTEFIRNMEHDIRTPFCGISGLAELLYEAEHDPVKKDWINDIRISAKELLNYCNTILYFSKIEAGILPILNKKFKLSSIIDSVIDIEKPAAKHRGLKLSLRLDNKLPIVVVGDRIRLHNILINLVSNAIKFTQAGYIKLLVTLIKKTNHLATIRFIVEDTGSGIPPDKINYIFEKFSRLTLSNKGIHKGVGTGLRNVKQFIRDLEGEIDVLSEEGKGSQFICTIPFELPLTDDFADECEGLTHGI